MATNRLSRFNVATRIWAELLGEQVSERRCWRRAFDTADEDESSLGKSSVLQEALRQCLDQSRQSSGLSISALVEITSRWIDWISRGVAISVEQSGSTLSTDARQFRLIIWRSRAPRRLKTIVSSSRSVLEPGSSVWHARLRSIFWQRRGVSGSRWLFGEGTAVAAAATRLAQLHGQSWTLLNISRASVNLWKWWRRVLDEYPRAPIHAAWASPPLGLPLGQGLPEAVSDDQAIPTGQWRISTRGWVDRLLVEWSDEIWLHSVRPQGAIEEAISSRLEAECSRQIPPAVWYLPVDFWSTLKPLVPSLREATISRYIVPHSEGWITLSQAIRSREVRENREGFQSFGSQPSYAVSLAPPRLPTKIEVSGECRQSKVPCSSTTPPSEAPLPIQCIPPWNLATSPPSAFLFHWTRANLGAWPDQTEAEYLDAQLWRVSTSKRSAFETLQRIIRMRRILGTSKLTRGLAPRVSFTQLTPRQLAKKRVFRKHLRRWDAEPYGIGIRTSVLQDMGARPVIYGPASISATLSPDQQLFFQPLPPRQLGQSTTGGSWRDEQEWRVLGSVNLELIEPNSVFVFVATEEERRKLQAGSPWPVYSGAGVT